MAKHDFHQSWERFLDPECLRGNLIAAATFVIAFETLRDSVTNHPREFYGESWDQAGVQSSELYEAEVLSLHRNVVRASLKWHLDRDILDDSDLAKFDVARKSRNKLAHEMLKWATEEALTEELALQLADIVNILKKVEIWWIANVEIPTNSDFDNIPIDPDEIVAGNVLGIQVLMEVALGEPGESYKYIKEFRERWGTVQPGDATDRPAADR